MLHIPARDIPVPPHLSPEARAGVPSDLHVMEAAPHGGFRGTAPEDDDLVREIRAFVAAHWQPTTV
jgi:hypothetical protein